MTPACAQACPTKAIAFGDINDPKSQVAQLKAQARNYSLLEDLNVRPRTTYLGRLKNPNPEIDTVRTSAADSVLSRAAFMDLLARFDDEWRRRANEQVSIY